MAKRRINWKRVRTLLLGLTAVILAAVGTVFSIQQWRQHRHTYYTDGVTIREPATSAQPRDILWQPPRALDAPINSAAEEYEPKLTADGETMYFVGGRPGGNADLFTSTHTLTPTGEQWSEPQPLEALNTLDDELGPQPTFDGRSLLFYSNRSGGFGGYDLWITHRGDDGAWSVPENLGDAVNSEYHEYSPTLAPDGRLLIYASNRPRYGRPTTQPDPKWPATVRERSERLPYDLFIARVDGDAVSTAQRIDALNTPRNEGTPAFSPAGDFLYFASDRTGLGGSYDLFRSRIVRGEFQPPEDLGPSINTPSNELDPALTLGGFSLLFSSDRVIDVADQRGKPNYNIFTTQSREVFTEVDHAAAAIDWAGLWETFAPSLLWLLLLLLAFLLLLAMMRGLQSRKLSLIARCLLASLIAHLIIMMLLGFWQVSVGVADMIRRGGAIKIALLPSTGSSELVAQVRGGLTDVSVAAKLDSSEREQTEVAAAPEPLMLVSMTELSTTEIDIDASAAVREALAEADPSSELRPPPVIVSAPADRPAVSAVEMPASESMAQQPEAALAMPRSNARPAARDAAGNAIPAPALGDPRLAAVQPPALQASSALTASGSMAGAVRPNDSKAQSSTPSSIATALVPLPLPSATPRDIADARLPDAAAPSATEGESVPTMLASSAGSPKATMDLPVAASVPGISSPNASPQSTSIESTGSLAAVAVPTSSAGPAPSSSSVAAAVPMALPLPTSSPIEVAVARMPEASSNATPQAEPSMQVSVSAIAGATSRPDLPVVDQSAQASVGGSGGPPSTAPATAINASTSLAGAPSPTPTTMPASTNAVIGASAVASRDIPTTASTDIAIPDITDFAAENAAQDEPTLAVGSGRDASQASRAELPSIDSAALPTGTSPSSSSAPAAASITATSSLAQSTISDSSSTATESNPAPAQGPILVSVPSAAVAATHALALPTETAEDAPVPVDERDLRIAAPSDTNFARSADHAPTAVAPPASATAMLDPTAREIDLPSSSIATNDMPLPRDAVAMLTGDARLRDISREPELPSGLNLDVQIPTEIEPPTKAYEQRAPEKRAEAVEKFGGSEETEKAVASALAWLARHQHPDGRWAAAGFDDQCEQCGGKARFDTDIATTGLALLCFLGADHTHMKQGPYQDRVIRGITWLKNQQRDNGDLRGPETMYSHGIAAIALSEAYGMTGDPELRDHVQRAINFIAEARNREMGGWRYEPGQLGDTSVLGWQVMAMVSAKRAGLEVPQDALDGAADWLQTRVNQGATAGAPASEDGLYAYQPGQRHSASMTAEGMFVLQLLGAKRDERRMRNSADFVGKNLPRWNDEPNTYYWYYATLALFQHQGRVWDTWNEAIKRQLLDNQRRSGPAAGSWDPLDNWSKIGGRVYQTAICTLSLEVYYRYLPLYAKTEE